MAGGARRRGQAKGATSEPSSGRSGAGELGARRGGRDASGGPGKRRARRMRATRAAAQMSSSGEKLEDSCADNSSSESPGTNPPVVKSCQPSPMLAAMAGPSSGGGGGRVLDCRSFWKAGVYEAPIVSSREDALDTGDFDHARLNFLHTNATSHKWAFGAIAELLDLAVDEISNGATYIKVDKSTNLKDNTPILIFQDDGGGMDPEAIRQRMSRGPIGQHGNGFTTSTMRLGADAIVFTRAIRGSNITVSIGLLSYTFLRRTMKDDIIIPMLDFKIVDGSFVPLVYGSQGDWDGSLKIILDCSPFSSKEELLQQFQDIGNHGTKVAVYNLWMIDDFRLELDFDYNDEDILLRDRDSASGEFAKIQKETVQQHISSRLRFSLRAYVSILYLRKFDNFQIILRGKAVEHITIIEDLKFKEEFTYKPQAKKGSQVVKIDLGFAKEAPVWGIFGINMYHKNRLIMPFWKVLQEENNGRSVIGVLEANYLEPSHGKQDFERTNLFNNLERKLKTVITSYWKTSHHLIGCQPVRSQYKKTLKDSSRHETQVQQEASSARRTGDLSPTLLPETSVEGPNSNVSVGGESAPAARKHVPWDDYITALLCTLYTSILSTDEGADMKMRTEIIAERMLKETGVHFTKSKIRNKLKYLRELYHFSKLPQKEKEKKCVKNKRGEFRKLKDGKVPPYFEAVEVMVEAEESAASKRGEFRKLKDGKVPPCFEAVEVMVEAEESAASKGQQDQLHHFDVQEKEEYRRIMRENEVLQNQYTDLQKKYEDLKEKFGKEVQQCKRLHNELVDIKGSIRVYCRCRPMNAAEVEEGAVTVIKSITDEEVVICDPASSLTSFKFDSVFSHEKDQEKVFERIAPFATTVLDGYDVCVFAYGQTGSGKTFTMEGVANARGINYRLLDEMFQIIKKRENTFHYAISISVVEVYNEEIYDLLLARSEPNRPRLEVRQIATDGKKVAHHVPGVVEARVNNIDEAWEVLEKGSKNRAVGSTKMNQHSSRSHCLHCVMVSGEDLVNKKCIKSKLWLVDLAGSERANKTGAEGETLKESQNINKSLSALGDVVFKLATNAPHIPFRDSKLTLMLQDALSGDAKCLMVVNISPAASNVNETLSSLRFATRVGGIGFKKQVDMRRYKQMEAKCEKMEKDVEALQAENQGQRAKIRDLESQLLCSPRDNHKVNMSRFSRFKRTSRLPTPKRKKESIIALGTKVARRVRQSPVSGIAVQRHARPLWPDMAAEKEESLARGLTFVG